MRNKVYEQKLGFGYRYAVIYEHVQHFLIESQKKMQQKAWGMKINLNLDQKMILLPKFLDIIYSSYF